MPVTTIVIHPEVKKSQSNSFSDINSEEFKKIKIRKLLN